MNKKAPSALQERVRKQYLEYLKLFPKMKSKNLGVYTTIILTLATLSFFLIFAIKPTLATILQLKKQIADSKFVADQMTTKLSALSILHKSYEQMPSDITTILSIVPQRPDVPVFLGQIQQIAEQSNLSIGSLNASPVPLSKNELLAKNLNYFTFSLELHGTYANLMQALTLLGHFNRLVSFSSVSLSKGDSDLAATIQGKAYFITQP